MRIGGLASGMDTDSMVKQIMKAENMKVDKVKAEKQVMEWRQQLYNEINKDFANFILKSKESFGYKNGRSSGVDLGLKISSSDEKIATVSPGGNKVEGTHNIDVKRLAEGVKGSGTLKDGIKYDTKFGEMGLGLGKFDDDGKYIELKEGEEPQVMTININGVNITISEADTMKEFVDKINNGRDVKRDPAGNIIRDKDGNTTEIRTDVKASYDEVNKRFFIQTTEVGEGAKIDISSDNESGAKFINDKLNITLSSYEIVKEEGKEDVMNQTFEELKLVVGDTPGTYESGVFKGVDAKIIYNGLEMKQSSNNFHLNGMSIGIKDTGKVSINISKDKDAAVEKIKEFVSEYNNMLDKVSGLLGEKVNRSFKPLTDEQKEALSEKEQELWEEKAKSGLLRNDNYLGKVLSDMRSDLYKDVSGLNGSFKNITELGITTQEYKAGAAGGKLKINEEKLLEALDKDFDGVMELLFKEDENNAIKDDSKLDQKELAAKRNNSGIVTRIFDNMIVGIKDIVAKSGTGADGDLFREVRSTILVDFTTKGGKYSGRGSISDIDDELFKFDKRIDSLNALLLRRENAHYAKFTAMEKAMQQMASQSGWLGQQTGGM